MYWSKLSTFIFFFPLIVALILATQGFEINTKDTLSLFLGLVWGVLVALGGGFFFISKIDFTKQKRKKQFMKNVSLKIQGAALAILVHTSLFVFLAFLFPVKRYIIDALGAQIVKKFNLVSVYDSLLYVEIIVPTIFSVLIGIWCILLVVNQSTD